MEKMLKRLIGEHISLVTVCRPDLGRVKADPGQIEQVIMNLVVNARDAMPNGGKLTIKTGNAQLDENYSREHVGSKPGRYVMLSVSDTGCGMDAETQKRIFEPFFTTKEQGKGTGLGLSTIYGIVKQNQGYIWQYSEVGMGTKFKIYLPVAAEAGEQTLEISVEPARLAAGTETILLVEDDESLRTLTSKILRKTGYTVVLCPNGEEALSRCQSHSGRLDLLLSDVVMPKMSGPETARRILSLKPDIKVLFMSGYADTTKINLRDVASMEKTAFLQKPFTQEGLLRKVREVLDAQRGSKAPVQ
jgi:CheY-like chemotaxis protein